MTLVTFGNALIKIENPIPKPIYNVSNPVDLKLLTRLWLGLSHLNQVSSVNFYLEAYQLRYSDVGSPSKFLHQHNKCFTKLIDQVSLFYQHSWLFSPKKMGIAYYICRDKIFDAFANPKLLHITTHQGFFFFLSIVIFLIAWLLFKVQ